MVRRLVLVLCLMLLIPAASRADGYLGSGGGLYRCAQASGKVPGGEASILVCSQAAAAANGGLRPHDLSYPVFAGIGGPAPVGGVIAIHTTKGSDQSLFYFDPFNPDPDVLLTFSMDPTMDTATIDVTAGSLRARLTLTGKGSPEQERGSRLGHVVDSSGVSCVFGAAGVGLERAASVVAGSSISSTRVGGGSVSSAKASMAQGIGSFVDESYHPAPNTYVFC